MTEASSINKQVAINGVPKGYGLEQIVNVLQVIFNAKQVTTNLHFAKNSDGSEKRNTIIVELLQPDFARHLLEFHTHIKVMHNSQEFTLKTTKVRNQPFCGRETDQDQEPTTSSKNFESKFKLLQTNYKANQSDKERHNNKRILYCNNIPEHMYRREALSGHFGRFGNILRLTLSHGRSKYAVIHYENHTSALLALKEAGDLGPLTSNLNISWFVRRGVQRKSQAFDYSSKGWPNTPQTRVFDRNSQVIRETPVSWREIVLQHRDIFCEPLNRCVLVQNLPCDVTNAALRGYFESYSRSGGGPIHRMIKLMDGLLIEFNDYESMITDDYNDHEILIKFWKKYVYDDPISQHNQVSNHFAAKNVADQEFLAIGDSRIRAYVKFIPPVYDNCFVIQGNFEDFSSVEALLDCFDDEQDTRTITELKENNSFLVTYNNSIDVSDITRKIKKIPLRSLNPKVSELSHTDCIMLEGIKIDLNNDAIKLSFMNKKLTNGGEVTFVNRNEDGSMATVYFANYQDAENVIQRSKQGKITILGGSQVTATLCFDVSPELNMSRCNEMVSFQSAKEQLPNRSTRQQLRSNNNVQQFDYEFLVDDSDMFEFVKRADASAKLLQQTFNDLASVNLVVSEHSTSGANKVSVTFKPVVREKLRHYCHNNQQKFENECIQTLHENISNYTWKRKTFPKEKIDYLRQIYKWDKTSNFIEVETDNNITHAVFVRWNRSNSEEYEVKVVGTPNDVSEVIAWLSSQCDYTVKQKVYNKDQFLMLQNCKIFEKVKEQFFGTVEVEVQEAKFKTIYKGLSHQTRKAEQETEKYIQSIKSSELTGLISYQTEFLRNAFRNKKNYEKFISNIFSNFKANNITVHIRDHPQLLLFYRKDKDKENVEIILRQLIKTREIVIENESDELLKSVTWQQVKQILSFENALIFEEFQQSKLSLIIVGTTNSIDSVHGQIVNFISSNVTSRVVVNLSYHFTLFLKLFPEELNANIELKGISWEVDTKDRNSSVTLTGKKSKVNKAKLWLQHQERKAVTSVKTLKEFNMLKYFQQKNGIEFLNTIQSATKCIIIPCDIDWSDKRKTKSSAFSKPQDTLRPITSQTKSTALVVNIIIGDLSEHSADVLVTFASIQNFASGAGSSISKAILNKCGNIFQRTCAQEVRNRVINYGDVIQTPACGLSCQKIYHAILSEYAYDKDGSYLINAIRECLVMADSNGYSSIAFPAMGIGGKNYPPDLVAYWLQQEISSFKGNTLRKVDVVLLPSSNTITSVFRNTFSPSNTSLSLYSLFTYSSLSINVVQGNASSINCDAMLVFQPITVHPHFVGVMQTAGNWSFAPNMTHQQNRFNTQNRRNLTSKFNVTCQRNSKCKQVVCIDSPNIIQDVVGTIQEFLVLADAQLCAKSVVIPVPLNIDLSRTNHQELERNTLRRNLMHNWKSNPNSNHAAIANSVNIAIQNFRKSDPKNLQRIDVVVSDVNIFHQYSSAISTKTSTSVSEVLSPASHPKPAKKSAFIIPNESDLICEETQFYLCSNNQGNIDEAWRQTCRHIEEKCTKKYLSVETLLDVEENEQSDLMNLEEKHNVKIRNSGNLSKLVISGLKDDVMEAYTAASEILQEYKEALTCAEYVVWKYKDPQSGKYVEFPLRTSFLIEAAYKKSPTNSLTVEISHGGYFKPYFINLNSMTETNLLDNSVTPIIRDLQTSPSSNDFPLSWENMERDLWKKVIVQPNSTEYQHIISKFQSTGSIRNVVQLERIQNPTLFKQFQAQKRKVEARMKSTGSTLPVTRNLFHGTSPDVCENIYKDGFDRSHAGRNATAYGRGVYFATTSQYSQSYAKPDNQGLHRMFYAEVVTGEFCQGNSSFVTPPLMPGSTTQRYDSVVNNTNNPAMFVVFKDASVYPSYMLTYR